jgi:hypothetical protein
VVAQVLDPNLSVTGFDGQTIVHTAQVEALLKQVAERGGMLACIHTIIVHLHL